MSWFYCNQPEYLHGFYSFSGNINVKWKPHLIQVPILVSALALTTPRALAPAPSQPGTAQRDFWIMIQHWAVSEGFPPPLLFFLFISFCATSSTAFPLSPVAISSVPGERMSPVALLIIYICAVKMSKCLTRRKQRAGNGARGEVFAGDPSQTELTEPCHGTVKTVGNEVFKEFKLLCNVRFRLSCCLLLSAVYKSTQRKGWVWSIILQVCNIQMLCAAPVNSFVHNSGAHSVTGVQEWEFCEPC